MNKSGDQKPHYNGRKDDVFLSLPWSEPSLLSNRTAICFPLRLTKLTDTGFVGPRSRTSQEGQKQSSSDSLKLLPNPANEGGTSLARILSILWHRLPYKRGNTLARLDLAQERLQLLPDTQSQV